MDLAVFVFKQHHYLEVYYFHLVVVSNCLVEGNKARGKVFIQDVCKVIKLVEEDKLCKGISQSLNLKTVQELMISVICKE